eukprot:COSAG01_NODE_13398_length_1591_cov_1.299598_1_plen_68_part_00
MEYPCSAQNTERGLRNSRAKRSSGGGSAPSRAQHLPAALLLPLPAATAPPLLAAVVAAGRTGRPGRA